MVPMSDLQGYSIFINIGHSYHHVKKTVFKNQAQILPLIYLGLHIKGKASIPKIESLYEHQLRGK